MTTAKTLIVLLIVLSFNGCTTKVLRCTTPNVERPILDNKQSDNILANAKRAISNYILMRDYALRLEEANKVCK